MPEDAARTDSVEDIEIALLLEAIHRRYHYDFRDYARASLKRRLKQACAQMGFASFAAMQDRLLHDEAFLPALLNYITIQVSEMFRDPAYFRALREQVVPVLRTWPSLKVWIAGCSSGEELYSMVILFREEGLEQRTIFYATDINPDALERTRQAIYPAERIRKFTENHRLSGGKAPFSDYYTSAYANAILDGSLKERVVIADHSLATDAVFSEMNLVSCRNVLIYFDRDLQDRAVGLFSQSLVNGGFLGLGSKESLRFSAHLPAFEDVAPREKIFRRRRA